MSGERIDHRQDANRTSPGADMGDHQLAKLDTFTDLLEILKQRFARGRPCFGVTQDGLVAINAQQAREAGQEEVMAYIATVIENKGKA